MPGALEIPQVLAHAVASGLLPRRADNGKWGGAIALGCVIRGETTHYDYVCQESARGLQDLAAREGIALGYGILTVENDDQAWARARVSEKNKGGDVARAALAMIALKRRFMGRS